MKVFIPRFTLHRLTSVLFLIVLSASVFGQSARKEKRAAKAAIKVEMPTVRSILNDSLHTTFRKLLWYRFGPETGAFFPNQAKMLEAFKRVHTYFSIDIFSSAPKSGFGLAYKFYYLGQSRDHFVPLTTKADRYFLTGPAFGYTYFFERNNAYMFDKKRSVLPYVMGDVEFLVGEIRVRDQNIDTKLRTSAGLTLNTGLLFADRWRFNIGYSILNPVAGYNMSNLSYSLSYLFYSVHRW